MFFLGYMRPDAKSFQQRHVKKVAQRYLEPHLPLKKQDQLVV